MLLVYAQIVFVFGVELVVGSELDLVQLSYLCSVRKYVRWYRSMRWFQLWKLVFLFGWVDILPYLVSFGCVLNDKEPLNPIGWLVKDEVDF